MIPVAGVSPVSQKEASRDSYNAKKPLSRKQRLLRIQKDRSQSPTGRLCYLFPNFPSSSRVGQRLLDCVLLSVAVPKLESGMEAVENLQKGLGFGLTLRQARNRRYYVSNADRLRQLARERKARLKLCGSSETGEARLKPVKASETRVKASETRRKASETGVELPSPPMVPPPFSPEPLNPPPLPPSTHKNLTRERRGSRLSAEWVPTLEHWQLAQAEGLTAVQFERVAVKFCDYWLSAAGGRSRKTNWDLAFRNWLRAEAERLSERAGRWRRGAPVRPADEVVASVVDDTLEARRAKYREEARVAAAAGLPAPVRAGGRYAPIP